MADDSEARLNFQIGWDKTLNRHLSRAIPHFEVAASNPKYREQALMAMASNFMHGHNCNADPMDPAMAICRTLVDEYPNSFEHWRSLGDAWLDCPSDAIDQSPEPMRCLENALRLCPNSVDVWYSMAMLLQHQAKFTDAIDCYFRVIELDPDNVSARFRLWLLSLQGRLSADSVPSPIHTPMVLEEFSGANILGDLKNSYGSARDSRARAVILRGYLRDVPFESIAHVLDPFQVEHFRNSDRRLTFGEIPDPEREILMDCIEDQLVAKIPAAWSGWPAHGFLGHRHDNWFFQVQEWGQEDRRTVLHQDHPVYSQESDWATFWFPLVPCGPGLAPTVRVMPAPLLKPIDWEIPFNRVNQVPQSLIGEYFAQFMVTVAAEPGDVLLFGRYVLHDTFVEPSMPQTRMSCDVRYTIGPARLSPGTHDEIRKIVEA